MRGIVGMLMILALVAAAQTAHAAATSLAIVDFAYDPGTLTVTAGDTVIWTNSGQSPHTVFSAAGGFSSGALASGSSFSQRFSQAGTFDYACEFHPQMRGSVVVLAESSAADPPITLTASAAPLPATGQPGGLVRPLLALLAGAALLGSGALLRRWRRASR